MSNGFVAIIMSNDVSKNVVLDVELCKVKSVLPSGELIEYYEFVYYADRELDISFRFKLNDKYKVAFEQYVKITKMVIPVRDETK